MFKDASLQSSVPSMVEVVLTSAAIKERVCMPYEAPSSPQTTARPQQANSKETSRQITRTWLFIGVEGEKDSCKKT